MVLGEVNGMAAPAAATTPTKARGAETAPPTPREATVAPMAATTLTKNDTEKAPPTPQDLAKVPPAPPRHMPSSAPTTSEDGLLQFGRPDGKAGVEGQSLQDAFKRFRKERRRTKKRVPAAVLAQRAAARRAADPGDNAKLRRKFIERAKHYIGTPYAERYHKPGDPLYGKPLYLDCCNLIRRCVQDLRADFGFDLGDWNQAYQFSTLPDAVAFGDLRPGDLMFVEATYRSGRHKQQRMNIVHVEIFLGEEFGTGPESTLGSRNRWGCVEVHDSFRYTSQFYDITNVFWRSLDPWCAGRCDAALLREVYGKHDPYSAAAAANKKKSIFAADDEVDAVPEEDAAFLCWADLDERRAAPSTVSGPMTLLDVLRDAGSVASLGAYVGFRDVGTLHAVSATARAVLESDDAAPAVWHAACAGLGRERGLFVPAEPAPAPGASTANASTAAAMAWKRLFFNQLWPARFKWDGDAGRTKRDFKIEVCVRFRPEDEGDEVAVAKSNDVVLPLHQYLRLQRDRRKDAKEDQGPLVGAAAAPPELLDAVTGREMTSPVRLPSGVVVDRAWAEAHLRRRGTDPYDGARLDPSTTFEPASEVRAKLAVFSKTRGAPAAVGVAGSEVVQRLAGSNTLDPTVLDAVLEAERLAASAAAAEEAEKRTSQRELLAEQDEEDDAAATARDRAPEDAPMKATAAQLTQGLEKAEAQVKEIEAEAETEADDAPRRAPSGAKVLAVQPTRVVVHVPGAGVRPFPFSRVFEDEDQARVHASVGAPAVAAVLNGLNACVLCYGQTGSGKTHTAFGPPGATEGGDAAGLVVRCLRDLATADCTVALQYVEIYNETVVDLLTGEPCDVRRDNGELTGCVEAEVGSTDDALRLLRAGSVRKRFAATQMNARSSRAHSVVVARVRQSRGDQILESTLQLVDLAGSERIYKSGAIKDAARCGEAVAINGSLMVLGKVIAALVEGRAHVPYLESKLSCLLRAALGGASRTTAVVCCRRRHDHADETLQALRFGKRCALVTNFAEQVAASSAADALKTIDATIAQCEQSLAGLRDRGSGNLATAKTLQDRLAQMRTRRRAITDVVRREARVAEA